MLYQVVLLREVRGVVALVEKIEMEMRVRPLDWVSVLAVLYLGSFAPTLAVLVASPAGLIERVPVLLNLRTAVVAELVIWVEEHSSVLADYLE